MTEKNKIASTGCCPPFDPAAMDENEFEWEKKTFIKDSVRAIFHIPLNMGSVLKRMTEKIDRSSAHVEDKDFILLSEDVSPWKSNQYIPVKKIVKGAENVEISGSFVSKVYEGPYKEAKNWYHQMNDYVKSLGKEAKKIYFYYTTCPKCAKVYGKNYVVAIAQV